VFIWYIFSDFGIFRQEKSGNPAAHNKKMNDLFAFFVILSIRRLKSLRDKKSSFENPIAEKGLFFQNYF
jgi:hypothetical protein